MKKTIKAIIVLFAIVTGGIAQAEGQCYTSFNFNTGQYCKICIYPDGRITTYCF